MNTIKELEEAIASTKENNHILFRHKNYIDQARLKIEKLKSRTLFNDRKVAIQKLREKSAELAELASEVGMLGLDVDIEISGQMPYAVSYSYPGLPSLDVRITETIKH